MKLPLLVCAIAWVATAAPVVAGTLSAPVELRAGPVRVRFADGELRYLKVGDTEIVRRIFFAVRSGTWDTLLPRFETVDLQRSDSGFTIAMEARCDREKAGYDSEGHYRWTGKIVGKSDGTITFSVAGEPTADFAANRIGICVLFGTPTVCERPYEIAAADGTKRTRRFPRQVNYPLAFEQDFTRISYTTADGLGVEASLAGTPGNLFSMEDQRNFADSSFKAYAVMPYVYPDVRRGARQEQTVTISLSGLLATKTARTPGNRIVVGDVVAGRTIPHLASGAAGERNWFIAVNGEREKARSAESVGFAYFPVEHLFDDDTCWENVPCIVELAESVRAFAPDKPLDIRRIALTLTHPQPVPEPRNALPMGAAWAAACIKYAALAGVRSATFDMGPGYAARLLRQMTPLVGQPLRAVRIESSDLTAPVDAFGAGETIVVINKTGARQQASLEGLSPGRWEAIELSGASAAGVVPPPTRVPVRGGKTSLNLAPHEVRFLAPVR